MDLPLQYVIPAFTALGMVVGALIGSRASRYNADVSKMNTTASIKMSRNTKISELLHKRTESLSDAMSSFISYGMIQNFTDQPDREFHEVAAKIELLIEPDDPDKQELMSCIYAIINASNKPEMYQAKNRYVEVCRRILDRSQQASIAALTLDT